MGSYEHISIAERRLIARMHAIHRSIRDIAIALGRSPSTISRELRRNAHHNGDRIYYTYTKAHEKSQARLSKSRKHSHFEQHIWDMVVVLLKKKWSPDQISHKLKIDHNILLIGDIFVVRYPQYARQR